MPTVNHYHVSENYFEAYWYIHLTVILLVEKKQLASMSKVQICLWDLEFGHWNKITLIIL